MIRLSKPYIPKSVYKDLRKVFESGNLVQGEFVQEFEKYVSLYLNVPFVKMVSSGTAALHLALLSLKVKPGDEVIIPAFTFPATANVVEIVGARPVLVDINLSDFCINSNLIEERITEKTRAIIPVHEFGQSADIKPIMILAEKYGLKVIEDAACALGTEFDDKKAGTFGDIGCFSLHPRKAISTGEGGMVVTSNEDLAEKISLLRNHGALKISGKLDFVTAGLNYRMTEFQAAIGIPQIKEIKTLINTRIKQADFYTELLKGEDSLITPGMFRERKNVFQTYHLLLRGRSRDDLINKLLVNQIEANMGAQAVNCLTYYRDKYGLKEQDFPNASLAYRSGLALPIGNHLTMDEIGTVAKTLIRILSS